MKTIEEIRLENLRSLIAKLGGPESFSMKIGKTPNQISQLANEHKGIGSKIAREVEEAINLERGWLDNDHSRAAAGAPPIEEKIYEAIRNDQALSILTKLTRTLERVSVDLGGALLALQSRPSPGSQSAPDMPMTPIEGFAENARIRFRGDPAANIPATDSHNKEIFKAKKRTDKR